MNESYRGRPIKERQIMEKIERLLQTVKQGLKKIDIKITNLIFIVEEGRTQNVCVEPNFEVKERTLTRTPNFKNKQKAKNKKKKRPSTKNLCYTFCKKKFNISLKT